nr:hypothetical protein [Ensifer aridi]
MYVSVGRTDDDVGFQAKGGEFLSGRIVGKDGNQPAGVSQPIEERPNAWVAAGSKVRERALINPFAHDLLDFLL